MQGASVKLAGGEVPEWVQLLPPGPMVKGRDGREWKFDSYAQFAVIDRFEFDGIDVVADWEHATEVKGPEGEEAPAAAWITELADREGDGSLWGRVKWTRKAAEQVAAGEYRYLSPVFSYTKTDRAIRVLESVGLTNKPNLRLRAFNRQAANMEEDAMKKALCRLLGLSETASDQEIQDAVAKLKGDMDTAANRAITKELTSLLGLEEHVGADQVVTQVKALTATAKNSMQGGEGQIIDLTQYVLRADYEHAMNRATTAESSLKELKDAELDGNIEIAVNRAISDGKIAPASKDFYVAMCKTEGGLDQFKQFAESAPKVIENPELPDQPKSGNGILSEEEKAVCRNLGLDEDEYAKSLKEDK